MELVQLVLLPALIGALTMVVMTTLKKVVAVLGEQSPLIQRIAVGVIAFGLTKLSALSGIPLPTELGAFDAGTIEAVLSWGAALGLHYLTKPQPPAV